MEEARQYSALTPAQWLYGVLLFGGTLVLLIGAVLQVTTGGDAIGIAALVFISMRIGTSALRAFVPSSVPGTRPNKNYAIMWLLIWVGLAFIALKVALT